MALLELGCWLTRFLWALGWGSLSLWGFLERWKEHWPGSPGRLGAGLCCSLCGFEKVDFPLWASFAEAAKWCKDLPHPCLFCKERWSKEGRGRKSEFFCRPAAGVP